MCLNVCEKKERVCVCEKRVGMCAGVRRERERVCVCEKERECACECA